MTDRPIIFSGPMVRAILDERKTQTRRLAWTDKPIPGSDDLKRVPSAWQKCLPGDRLWVRESFWPAYKRTEFSNGVVYRSDYIKPTRLDPSIYHQKSWKPSIHMPRWASRLTLLVEAVKVERLQDISEEDAQAEGAEPMHLDDLGNTWKTYARGFQSIWERINGPAAWNANPLVVAVTFRVVKANIEAIGATAA